MSIGRLPILAIVALGMALASCGPSTAGSQLAVNGEPVSVELYHAIVSTEQHKFEWIGSPVNWQSPSGQRRRADIEASVIRELVRDAVVEQLAAAHGITVTAADLEQGLAAAEQTFGGPVAFEQDLEQAGLARSEFSSLLRYRMLESRLTQRGAASEAAIAKAVGRARVVATIGPCAGNHTYPACLTPN